MSEAELNTQSLDLFTKFHVYNEKTMTESEFKQWVIITMGRTDYKDDAYEIVKWHPRYKELFALGILDITVQVSPHNHSQQNFVIETRLPYLDNCFTIMGIKQSYDGYRKRN